MASRGGNLGNTLSDIDPLRMINLNPPQNSTTRATGESTQYNEKNERIKGAIGHQQSRPSKQAGIGAEPPHMDGDNEVVGVSTTHVPGYISFLRPHQTVLEARVLTKPGQSTETPFPSQIMSVPAREQLWAGHNTLAPIITSTLSIGDINHQKVLNTQVPRLQISGADDFDAPRSLSFGTSGVSSIPTSTLQTPPQFLYSSLHGRDHPNFPSTKIDSVYVTSALHGPVPARVATNISWQCSAVNPSFAHLIDTAMILAPPGLHPQLVAGEFWGYRSYGDSRPLYWALIEVDIGVPGASRSSYPVRILDEDKPEADLFLGGNAGKSLLQSKKTNMPAAWNGHIGALGCEVNPSAVTELQTIPTSRISFGTWSREMKDNTAHNLSYFPPPPLIRDSRPLPLTFTNLEPALVDPIHLAPTTLPSTTRTTLGSGLGVPPSSATTYSTSQAVPAQYLTVGPANILSPYRIQGSKCISPSSSYYGDYEEDLLHPGNEV